MNRLAWLLVLCMQLPEGDPVRMRLEPLLTDAMARLRVSMMPARDVVERRSS
jgi:hypothetical protein